MSDTKDTVDPVEALKNEIAQKRVKIAETHQDRAEALVKAEQEATLKRLQVESARLDQELAQAEALRDAQRNGLSTEVMAEIHEDTVNPDPEKQESNTARRARIKKEKAEQAEAEAKAAENGDAN